MFINSLKKKHFPNRRLIVLLLTTGLLGPNAARAMDEDNEWVFIDGENKQNDSITSSDGLATDDVSESDDLMICVTNKSVKLPLLTEKGCKRENERLQREEEEKNQPKPKPLQSWRSTISSWSNGEDY